jgi:hypothetical protein
MSQVHTYSMTCPHCGHDQQVEVWNALNISVNPELRYKLFNAEINVFVCEICDHKALINVPLLYHDVQRRYGVQYYPPDSLKNEQFLEQFTDQGKMDLSRIHISSKAEGHYLTDPHIVFDLNEMLRYIDFRDKVYDLKE